MLIAKSRWLPAPIKLYYDYCKDLVRMEIAYTRLLQIKQRPDLYTEEYYRQKNDGISYLPAKPVGFPPKPVPAKNKNKPSNMKPIAPQKL